MLPASKPISVLPAANSQNMKVPLKGPLNILSCNESLDSLRTLLGEKVFAYVSCQADIGYAITLMSKYSSKPSVFHYKCLKGIANYLRTTWHWGIKYKQPKPRLDLKPETIESIPHDSDLPPYPEDTTQGKLICFVDAAYGIINAKASDINLS